ncbi:putative knottin, scorpion toxin [Helianthus anomalus]
MAKKRKNNLLSCTIDHYLNAPSPINNLHDHNLLFTKISSSFVLKMMNRSVAFSAFVLILFVLAISDIASVRGELCEKASKTWSGNCGNTGHCDNQCKTWEGAAHGACHVRGGKHMCFCYFNCKKAEKLAQDKLKAENLAKEKLNAENLDRDAKKVVPNVEHP